MADIPPIKPVPGGVTLVVRVTPRSRKNEIIGADGQALRVKLTAPPVGGAANAALCEFLAGVLGVRKSAVTLVAGQSSRHKSVRVEGITADQACTRLNDTIERATGEGGSRVKRVEF